MVTVSSATLHAPRAHSPSIIAKGALLEIARRSAQRSARSLSAGTYPTAANPGWRLRQAAGELMVPWLRLHLGSSAVVAILGVTEDEAEDRVFNLRVSEGSEGSTT